MKILLVTRNFPPLVGGMERLMYESFRALAAEFDLALIGPPGCQAQVGSAQALDCALRPLPRFLAECAWRAATVARRFQPRVVLSGSGLTAPIALASARLVGAVPISFVHGLDLVARHPVYRLAWLPALRRMAAVLANSRYTASLAGLAGVPPPRVRVLHPGVALPLAPGDGQAVRRRLGLAGRFLLLSVGRMTPRKGVAEFIRYGFPAVLAERPDAVLLVAGAAPAQALTGGSAEDAIRAAIQAVGVAASVRLLGSVDEDALDQLYTAADVFVFPVRELPGDVEGFGMAALEAAAHGLPTVAFACGGVPDAVADGRSGWLIPPDDYPAFAKAVVRLSGGANQAIGASAREFAADFAWAHFGRRLRGICAELGSP